MFATGRIVSAGTLALPILLVAATTVLVVAAAERPKGHEKVELELAAVVPLPDSPGRLLVLREKSGQRRILPIVLAGAYAANQKEATAAQPPHGGLLGRTLIALGARVRSVEIEGIEESASSARVSIEHEGREITLVARPSESVALALESGAPVLAARALLDREGITAEDLARTRDGRGDPLPTNLF